MVEIPLGLFLPPKYTQIVRYLWLLQLQSEHSHYYKTVIAVSLLAK